MKTEIRTDIARYRIEKANKNLVEERDAFALGHHELTVGRSYYGVFIAMKALLALEGITPNPMRARSRCLASTLCGKIFFL